MKKSLLLLILLICIFTLGINGQDSLMFRSLEPHDFHLLYLREDPAILIDVREPFEFKSKRIKGAINIPASGNLDASADTLDRNNAIFIYCSSGFRSDRAARALYVKGFRKLYSLKGGIIQWQREGMKVEKRSRRAGRQREGEGEKGSGWRGSVGQWVGGSVGRWISGSVDQWLGGSVGRWAVFGGTDRRNFSPGADRVKGESVYGVRGRQGVESRERGADNHSGFHNLQFGNSIPIL